MFAKRLKKQFLSINNSIESFFNQIKQLFEKIKKTKFDPNNRAFLIFGLIVILIFTLFSIPSFYDKNIIKSKIKNQIYNLYDVEIRFNEKLNFSLLPKPHFVTKNFSIIDEDKEIAKVKNFKVYISNKSYFAFNDINIKDLILNKAEFHLNEKNINFFKKFLFTDPSENKVVIKNSKIFYKDLNDDVLFISKIFESKFFYDYNKLENNLLSKNEIFNLPFNLKVKNNYFNKKISINLDSNQIRLRASNETNYKDDVKNGLVDIGLINKNTKFNYQLDKKSIKFNSIEKDLYSGRIDFKPFYFSSKLNYENLSLKKIIKNKSFLIELLKSEILNNENLNINLDLNIKNILDSDKLKDLSVKVEIIEGNLSFSNSELKWNDNIKIKLSQSFLDISDNDISLFGKLIFEFKDIQNFYRFYQVKKINRKKLKKIEIDFVYSLIGNDFRFDNPKIDNSISEDLEKLIENFNNKKVRVFNKITFKNFLNDFFSAYAG